jgi:exonuclease SbcC
MIPHTLTIQNFMCYRSDGDGAPLGLNLDGLHVVCLSGENGAGKSALLDAITWALWGEARTPDDDLIAQGESEMLVELVFQLGDQRYRVARRRQRGGSSGKRGGTASGKTFLDLQVKDAAGWKPIAEAGVRETQARIDDLLRMSYQTFINASFLLQGRADEFTARTPAERKQVLADILDLKEYQALEEQARARAREMDGQLRGLRGRIEQLEESAGKLPFWAERVKEAEGLAARYAEQLAQAEAGQQQAAERLRQLEAKADRRKGLLRELEALRAERQAREQELAALRGRIVADEQLVARRAVIAAGVAELAAAREELDRLEGLRGPYDDLSRRQDDLRREFSEARGELRSRLAQQEQREEQLARYAERRDALVAEAAGLRERLVALGPLAVEREARMDERQALDVRADQMAALRRRHDQLESLIKLRQDSLVAVREENQRALRRLDEQLKDELRWLRELEESRAAIAELAAGDLRLAELREQERVDVDGVSQQRAECQRLKAAADKLKANQQILADAGGACPVCRSELGEGGVAHVQAHYDTELAGLRSDYAEAKRQADAGDARLKATRAAAAGLDRRLGELRRTAAQADALEGQIRQAEGWRADRAQAQEAYHSAEQQLARGDFEPASQAELATARAELAALGDPAELAQGRKMLDERLRELDVRLRERDKAEGLLHARQEELARVETELAALPEIQAQTAELRRVIAENDFAHEIRRAGQEVGAALAALGYRPEAHAAARDRARDLERWREEEQELRLAEQRLNADRALLAKAEELQARASAEVDRLTREDALLEQELRELPRAKAEADAGTEALRRARMGLQVVQNDLGEKRAYLKTAQEAADQLEREREDERALAHRQGLFAELGEAFGKKGVQAMLIETAIPQIEDEANRLLGRMTDNQMHLSFEMQRDTKKGDTVETLEIKIADALGTRVYDAFSGGEAMRANFAVRIALSRLLARRAGARLETLVIDEGFGSLDALGRERMVEAITGVQDDFRRIIVITHIDELKDKFPALIEVTKTPAGSRWELR